MAKTDSLGDRMKRYETVSQMSLMRRTPVIIRIDGKAFHTFTKTMDKPFDAELSDAMLGATIALVKHVQGAVLGYTQSDEISILCQDWASLTTDAWFDYNIQKVVSVSASIATASFARNFNSLNAALFDARVFNLPREEVCNYFIWRQQDATRNSIQAVAQANFSHGELHGLNMSQLQDKLMLEKNINWNDIQTRWKRGQCIDTVVPTDGTLGRAQVIDREIPIFTQNRTYIEKHL